MGDTLAFQDMILRLVDYWKTQGCVVWQPYNVRVGAGTMNPGSILRVLGPEPWNIVYVEPSVRPDDGRYGDNPNRMQQHTQLQVILQPDPGNPQELFLKSLEAIGISSREHDIRFVEDNWESPALGAWGLGWEVWLDGQEITQFTYFQQSGSTNLDPVAVEITYGLDRIALALQGVDSVWKMDYGSGATYADLLLDAEIEQCKYYFDLADVETIRQMYDMSEREAQRCIDAGLVIPAHDYNLHCSHLFNVLDTRGAVGVTERADSFRRMRRMARQISERFIEQREEQGFPLKERWPQVAQEVVVPEIDVAGLPGEPAGFLLEIGSEELPANDLTSAIQQLQKRVPALLDELRLTHEGVTVQGTPRRIAVTVANLASGQPDLVSEIKGPPAERAFDADGNPTRAAQGFARGKGVDVANLKIIEEGDKRYVAAVVDEKGQSAASVLAEALPKLIAALRFPKSMRWNHTNIAHSRPLRWLVALHGAAVVPFEYAGVVSGRTSRGIRPYDSPEIEIARADDYPQLMATSRVVVDADERRDIILKQATALAAEVGGSIPDDAGLLAEVVNLNESPTPLRGTFDEKYLRLPAEVLVAVMRKHQRYFPLYDGNGALMPYFITVRNGDEQHIDIVTDGNEQVLRARFADAEFFYANDLKLDLETMRQQLGLLTFQKDLGSMLDKTERLQKSVPAIAGMLGLNDTETEVAARVAAIGKADLASNMVVEMTSLQGIMGGHYATLNKESDAVAQAIAAQYQVVTPAGAALAYAVADRLDSLVGLFAAGIAPKGSNDPFALRRAAIQLIENLIANQVSFDVRAAIATAAQALPVEATDEVLAAVGGFVTGRLEVVLREQGTSAAVVKAVLAEQAHDPFAASEAAKALEAAIAADGWSELLDAYARCVRIVRKETETHVLRPDAFTEADEKTLHAAYAQAAGAHDGTVETLVASIKNLEPSISAFFENLLVNAEEADVRSNRLALMQHIAALSNGIADLSELEGF